MKALKKLLPSTADFRPPTFLLGMQFDGIEKQHYEKIQKAIEDFMQQSGVAANRGLLAVTDLIEDTKKIGMSKSMEVLTEIVKLIRIQLLSNDPAKVYCTVILIDGLIKNSGYRIHILIGRRRFMKTYGLVLRRHRSHVNSVLHQRVSALMIDCIQAYGEAFMTRRMLYPFIYDTYYKIRNKYFIRFPRPDYDPTRVPIFLGEITAMEIQLAKDFPDDQSVASANSPRSSSYINSYEETKETEDGYGYRGSGGGRGGGNGSSGVAGRVRNVSDSDRVTMDRETHPRATVSQSETSYRFNYNRPTYAYPPAKKNSYSDRNPRVEQQSSSPAPPAPPVKQVQMPKKTPGPVASKEEAPLLDFSEPAIVIVTSPSTVAAAASNAQTNNASSFKFPSSPPPPPPPACAPQTGLNTVSSVPLVPTPMAAQQQQPTVTVGEEYALVVPARPPPRVLNPRVLGTNEKAAREGYLTSHPFDDLSMDVERMKMQAASSSDVKTASTGGSSSSNNPKMLRRTRSENDHHLSQTTVGLFPEYNPPPVPRSQPASSAEVVHLRPVSRRSPLDPLPEETQDPITGEVNEQSGKFVAPTTTENTTPTVAAAAAPTERTGTYYRRQQELKRAASTGSIVSSDPNVDIHFYGTQRVVVKK